MEKVDPEGIGVEWYRGYIAEVVVEREREREGERGEGLRRQVRKEEKEEKEEKKKVNKEVTSVELVEREIDR